jgi:hypothetical protein
MGLFKSKAQKEYEKKIVIRKTLTNIQKQINSLEQQKKVYINAAKKAKQLGLKPQYDLAVTGLRMTMAQQKRAQEMQLNYEIFSQMKDMTAMTSDFLQGLSVLSKEMTKLTDQKEFAKVQQQFQKAMQGAQMQTEQMETYLDMSQSEFNSSVTDPNSITDDEIGKLLDEQSSQDEIASIDLDAEIAELQKKLKN